jgi:hypothetical protein
VTVSGERATVGSGSVAPQGKVVQATITTKTDGVFVEAQLDTNGNDDMSPLGITPNRGKAQGTFFYAVGANSSTTPPSSSCPSGCGADRVGFVRLPMPKKLKHPRDDDDAEDGWAHNSHPSGWHMSEDDDDDGDGQPNEFDTPTANEIATIGDPAPLGAGQTADYPMTASPTSLALIAVATAESDPTALLSVDIYDALGVLVATSPVTPGVAAVTALLPVPGNYTARVHNQALGAATHTPTLIVREPWQP